MDAPRVVTVPAGTHSDSPLRLTLTAGEHVRLEVGEGAVATVIEEFGSVDRDHWEHTVDVHVSARASLTYLSLQALSSDVHCIIRHRAAIDREAEITWHLATLGGKTVDHLLRSEVAGEGGKSTIDWLFFAAKQERQTLSVQNIFSARNGGGDITMKGVAQDHAHASARGMIAIGPKGGGTNTYLTQSVLMLDPTAKVDAVPGLEIKTNDVKASHSASVTCVSEEDLFYFAARGISHHDARRMYIEGFLGDIAERITDPNHRELVKSAIERKYSAS